MTTPGMIVETPIGTLRDGEAHPAAHDAMAWLPAAAFGAWGVYMLGKADEELRGKL